MAFCGLAFTCSRNPSCVALQPGIVSPAPSPISGAMDNKLLVPLPKPIKARRSHTTRIHLRTTSLLFTLQQAEQWSSGVYKRSNTVGQLYSARDDSAALQPDARILLSIASRRRSHRNSRSSRSIARVLQRLRVRSPNTGRSGAALLVRNRWCKQRNQRSSSANGFTQTGGATDSSLWQQWASVPDNSQKTVILNVSFP